jgi:hypothetical protein
MNNDDHSTGRREQLRRGVVLFACAAAAGILRPAAAKTMKADFYYQDVPKNGKSCGTCRQFTATSADAGTCSVVEGDVKSSGWCLAYAPRAQS